MSVSIPSSKASSPSELSDRTLAIPSLKDGDRLTREEFERRYDAMASLGKAELIEGVVHVPSPVRQQHHSAPHFSLIGWLFNYQARTPGVKGGVNPSVPPRPGQHASAGRPAFYLARMWWPGQSRRGRLHERRPGLRR